MTFAHAAWRTLLTLVLPCMLLLVTSGCATIVTGTRQSVAFNSRPQGAHCELVRDGSVLSEFTTPAVATVVKGAHDLDVTCSKEGYAPIAGAIPSDLNGWVAGNIMFGLAGLGIDLATGADQDYPPVVTVALHAEAPPSPPPQQNTPGHAGMYMSAK